MTLSESMHKGENAVKEITPSRWAYFWAYLIGVILIISIIGIVFGIIIIVITELVRRGNKYYITNKRVIHEFIFLSRKINSTTYEKIQDIHLTQSLIDRIFGIGTIHINTAGSYLIEIKFKGVENPISVKRMIEEKLLRKHR